MANPYKSEHLDNIFAPLPNGHNWSDEEEEESKDQAMGTPPRTPERLYPV